MHTFVCGCGLVQGWRVHTGNLTWTWYTPLRPRASCLLLFQKQMATHHQMSSHGPHTSVIGPSQSLGCGACTSLLKWVCQTCCGCVTHVLGVSHVMGMPKVYC